MTEREGVIKYQLEHNYQQIGNDAQLVELNAWRTLLYRLNLIGQIPEKYDGLGFGNLSCRLVPNSSEFLISGTQTGSLPVLEPQHYAIVHAAIPRANYLRSTGMCAPSSEALTHGSVYLHTPAAQAVLHVHSPELWLNTQRLALPHTAADISYGTTAMADAVADLFNSGQLQTTHLFSMLGHEDGIVAFGSCLQSAFCTLVTYLAKAIALAPSHAKHSPTSLH